METIFVDTSAWYAIFDTDDSNHLSAVSQKDKIAFPLVTTNFVIDETITLITKNLGAHTAYKIGNELLTEHFAKIVRISLEDEKEALEIIRKYSDKKFGFTDCTSFVIMEKSNIKTAFSFDIHFKQYGKFTIIP